MVGLHSIPITESNKYLNNFKFQHQCIIYKIMLSALLNKYLKIFYIIIFFKLKIQSLVDVLLIWDQFLSVRH